ncbi:MAG: PAS domain S-box protein [Aulosira sp. ZfuVER01]|nr:PAS domain S-box protein [Aulosira sp. ZfuVER01]MDZ7999404.1 PAS domain S-box protein [Aulosira sp. DedVER01a]MDZ8055411.1 PAS domain S-box protein [Aulosira sp. ZfuCHP01]
MSAEQLEQVKLLQATLTKMEVTLGAIADAVVWVGEDRRVQWCNSSFECLVNRPKSAIAGWQLSELLPLLKLGKPVALNSYPDVLIQNGKYETTEYEFHQGKRSLVLQISGSRAGLNEDDCAVLVIQDITLAQQAQKSFQESEERLRTLINATPDIICLKDSEGKWLESNQANLEFLEIHGVDYKGKTDSELAQFSDFYHDTLLNCDQTDEQAWQQGSVNRVEEVVPRPDGTVSIVDMIKVPVFHPDGRRKALVVLGRDVSDRKLTQVALENSLSLLSAILESIQDGILAIDSLGNITSYNQKFLEMWSIPPELLTEPDHPKRLAYLANQLKDPQGFLQRVRELYAQPELDSYDFLELQDGRVFERYSCPQRIKDQIIGRVWSFRDVTQRQKTEAALRQSELQYRSIFEAINDGLFITDIETETVAEVNPAACQMHGYTYEEFITLHPSVYIHPNSHPVFYEFLETTRAGGQFYGQAVDICKDGTLIDVEVKGTTCIYNGKRHVLAIVRDISDRKRTEAALRQSEVQYRDLVQTANCIILRWDSHGDIIYLNDYGQKLFGFDAQEIIGRNVVGTIVPETETSGRDLQALMVDICQHPENYLFNENENSCKNGDRVWIVWANKPILDEQGNLIEILSVGTDATERKRAQAALQQSEIKFRTIVENANDLIFTISPEGIFTYHSPNVTPIMGYTLPEIEGHSVVEFTYPEDLAISAAGIQKAIAGEKQTGIEVRLRHKNNSWRWFSFNTSTINTPDGEIAIAGVGRDITERKQTEEALRRSEMKYRNIFENSQVGIFRTRQQDGLIVDANQRGADILGFAAASDLIGRYFTTELYVNPNDRARMLAELAASGEVRNFELALRRGDGSVVWVLLSLRLNAEESCLDSVFTDISDRKQVEQALQSRAQLESILSSISRQFIDQDIDTAINFTLQAIAQFINAERCSIFELSDQPREVYIVHEWRAADIPPLSGNARRGNLEMFPLLAPILIGQNSVLPCIADLPPDTPEKEFFENQSIKSALGVPMIHSGKVVGFIAADTIHYTKNWNQQEMNLLKLVGEIIAIGRARHQAEAALRVAKEAAETANRAKSAFLANMSHELRTPLNAILGFSQLMERDASLNSNQRESLATINRSGEHLLNLINDVLEMSKIEAGQIVFNPEDFDLYLMLQTLQEMFQVRAQTKQLYLKFEIAADLPRYIQTDEGKLRQVLINLLGNAIKFTQTGGVTLRARLGDEGDAGDKGGKRDKGDKENNYKSMPHSQFIIFEVEDTGRGIAAAEMNNLFQPFVQTSSGIQTKEGTGLGLTISRQFVRLLGGDIHLCSNLGQGSTFSFDIQVNLATPLKVTPKLSRGRVLKLAADQPTYRILVVDDRKENRDLMMQLLGGVGFEVEAASNGQEAIAMWQKWQPQLIWMDMRMPVMNGYDATKEIRARERSLETNSHTVIIALTASAFEEQQASILAAGCDDLIRKPFREQIIFEKIAEYLHLSYLFSEESSENITDKKSENVQYSMLDIHSAITIMPTEWIGELHQAAIAVDGERIFQLIEQIPQSHADLAEKLLNLVRSFCFDEILELTSHLFN